MSPTVQRSGTLPKIGKEQRNSWAIWSTAPGRVTSSPRAVTSQSIPKLFLTSLSVCRKTHRPILHGNTQSFRMLCIGPRIWAFPDLLRQHLWRSSTVRLFPGWSEAFLKASNPLRLLQAPPLLKFNELSTSGTISLEHKEIGGVMTIKKFANVFFLLTISIIPLQATAPVPRQSPELKFLDGGGREVQLSSFKGKVVVVEFLFLRSDHCMRVAQTLNKLNTELAPEAFKSVGILFGQNANGIMVNQVTDALKLTYPMGYTSPDQVDAFLGRQGKETL